MDSDVTAELQSDAMKPRTGKGRLFLENGEAIAWMAASCSSRAIPLLRPSAPPGWKAEGMRFRGREQCSKPPIGYNGSNLIDGLTQR